MASQQPRAAPPAAPSARAPPLAAAAPAPADGPRLAGGASSTWGVASGSVGLDGVFNWFNSNLSGLGDLFAGGATPSATTPLTKQCMPPALAGSSPDSNKAHVTYHMQAKTVAAEALGAARETPNFNEPPLGTFPLERDGGGMGRETSRRGSGWDGSNGFASSSGAGNGLAGNLQSFGPGRRSIGYEVDKEDLLDQHVGYYLRHHPNVYAQHSIVRKRPGIYEFDGREIMVEWQCATDPGGQGHLVTVDGPLRQPFADYIEMTEANAEYDSEGIQHGSLHNIPKNKRMSFQDTHKMYSRLEAMKVAKEQALVRERAAGYVRDGRDVPGDLMQKYKTTIQIKLDPGGRRVSAARQRQAAAQAVAQAAAQAVPGAPPPSARGQPAAGQPTAAAMPGPAPGQLAPGALGPLPPEPPPSVTDFPAPPPPYSSGPPPPPYPGGGGGAPPGGGEWPMLRPGTGPAPDGPQELVAATPAPASATAKPPRWLASGPGLTDGPAGGPGTGRALRPPPGPTPLEPPSGPGWLGSPHGKSYPWPLAGYGGASTLTDIASEPPSRGRGETSRSMASGSLGPELGCHALPPGPEWLPGPASGPGCFPYAGWGQTASGNPGNGPPGMPYGGWWQTAGGDLGAGGTVLPYADWGPGAGVDFGPGATGCPPPYAAWGPGAGVDLGPGPFGGGPGGAVAPGGTGGATTPGMPLVSQSGAWQGGGFTPVMSPQHGGHSSSPNSRHPSAEFAPPPGPQAPWLTPPVGLFCHPPPSGALHLVPLAAGSLAVGPDGVGPMGVGPVDFGAVGLGPLGGAYAPGLGQGPPSGGPWQQ